MQRIFNHHVIFVGAIIFALLSVTCSHKGSTQELLDANFIAAGQARIDLLSPTENQQVTTANPTLAWSDRGVNLYTLEVATDSLFSSIIIRKDIPSTTYTVVNSDLIGMSSLTTASYYWRVRISKLSSSLQSKTGSFFLVAIPANDAGYAGALYVNGSSTSNLQLGSKEAPYKKIQSAIGASDALRNNNANVSMDIYVAQGTYSEEINPMPGISIRGGYNPNGWTRNVAAYTTTILAPADIAIKGNPSVTTSYTGTTWIEGFTIQGVTAQTTYAISLIGSSPTIANNNITTALASNGDSYGIYASNSSPTILNNVIASTGAIASNASIYFLNSSGIISGNLISSNRAGASAGSYGILVIGGSPLIMNNAIYSGPVTPSSESFGIYLNSSASAISNNTIVVGPGPGIGANTTYAIFMSVSSTPAIRNNILHLSGKSATRIGIYENGTGDNPVAIRNNAIYDTGTGGNFFPYRDADGGGLCYTGGMSSGGNCVNIADMEADLNAESSGTVGGNISQNPSFLNLPVKLDVTIDAADTGAGYSGTAATIEVFNCTDYAATEYFEYNRDGIARQISSCSTATGSGIVTFTPALSSASSTGREIRLWGTNNTNLVIDFHLQASSPCDVRQGGLDLSALFTIDRDSVPRTAIPTCGPVNSGAAGWSTGAYESN